MNVVSFCLSQKVFISTLDMKDILWGTVIEVGSSYFLSGLEIYHSMPSLLLKFLLSNAVVILIGLL
jgi:hypothetical protein